MSQESLVTFGDQGDIFKIDTGEAGAYFNAKPTNDGGIVAVWENDSSGSLVYQKFLSRCN